MIKRASLFFDNDNMKLLTFAKAVRLSRVLGIFLVGLHLERSVVAEQESNEEEASATGEYT
jgi:hypothetical protein